MILHIFPLPLPGYCFTPVPCQCMGIAQFHYQLTSDCAAMGAAGSKSSNEASLAAAKEELGVICDEYISFVQYTSAMIDVTLDSLDLEVQGFLQDTKKVNNFTDGDMSELESYWHNQRVSVLKLFEILAEAHHNIEGLVQPSVFDCEELTDFISDDELLHQTRPYITKALEQYCEEMKEVSLADEIIESRKKSLKVRLYKLADEVVSEAIEEFISDCKEACLEELDNMLCIGITTDALNGASIDSTRSLLKGIINVYKHARELMDEFPFNSKLDVIANAQREVANAVTDLMRRIQMTFIHNPTFLDQIMDFDVVDDVNIEDYDEDEMIEEGDSDEDADDESDEDDDEDDDEDNEDDEDDIDLAEEEAYLIKEAEEEEKITGTKRVRAPAVSSSKKTKSSPSPAKASGEFVCSCGKVYAHERSLNSHKKNCVASSGNKKQSVSASRSPAAIKAGSKRKA